MIAIADSAGFITEAYAGSGHDQSSWQGAGLTTQAQTFDPRKWQTNDQWGGIQQFRNRAYDPATGTWIQEDPMGVAGGVNLYRFNNGNPVSFGDPLGLCPPRDSSPCTLGDVLSLNVSAGLQLGASVSTGVIGVFARTQAGRVANIEVSAKNPVELTVSDAELSIEFGGELMGQRGGLKLDVAKDRPQFVGTGKLAGADVGHESVQRDSRGKAARIGLQVGLGFDLNISLTAVADLVEQGVRKLKGEPQ